MEIKDNILNVKSAPHFYSEEKDGGCKPCRKPYTVRWMSPCEFKEIIEKQPELIRVHNTDTGESFTRQIVAVHSLGVLLGQHLVGITMDPVIVVEEEKTK